MMARGAHPESEVKGGHGDDLDPSALDGAELELTVGPVAHGGHCVARADDGRVVFVRHTLPGERVRARVTEVHRGYLRADAVAILTASPDRVTPPCPWAGPDRCGGCDFQHATLPAQRELKAAVVREQLHRLAGLTPAEVDQLGVRVQPLPGLPAAPGPPAATGQLAPGNPDMPDGADGLGWRSRVHYTVDSSGRAGLLKHRSHEVVAVDRCLIAHPAVQGASVQGASMHGVAVLGAVWTDVGGVAVDGIDVVASASGEVSVLAAPAGGGHPVLVSGPARVRERALGREWSIPPEVFWQVHPGAADTLAAAVVQLLAPQAGERAWDLYGGVGLFAVALAPHLDAAGRITVVESDPRTAAAARRCLKDVTTVTVACADVGRALANPRWRRVDLVVLDPPRAGAGAAVVRAIVARGPRAVAYVACDPAALARDVRTFRDAGWRLAELRAYDLFPMTHHVECIALIVNGS